MPCPRETRITLTGYHLRLLALFDKEGERKNYLILQEILTDMRLTERASIGRQFHTVAESMSGKTSGLTMAAALVDGQGLGFRFHLVQGS